MATRVTDIAEELFFSDSPHGHNCMVLTCARGDWKSPPKHLLAIPHNWRDVVFGDFSPVRPVDFGPREMILRDCAKMNAKSLESPGTDDGIPYEWSVVVRMGAWLDTSFLCVNDKITRTATLMIDTTFTVVRPTAEEIERLGSIKQSVPMEGGAV